MKKILQLLLFVFISISSTAQIVGPDTIYCNNQASYTTLATGTTFTWNLSTSPFSLNMNAPGVPTPVASSATGLTGTQNTSTVFFDNGNYYSFCVDYYSGILTKLSYGNSPLNAPTYQNVATPSGISLAGCVDAIKDATNNRWYIFYAASNKLVRVDMGTTLANNSGTVDILTNVSQFDWPHDLKISTVNNQYIGFVANRNGAISRLVFGATLSSWPTITNIPISNYSNPVSFSVVQQNGSWYMLSANLLGSFIGVSRLDFGNSLLNTPTVTHLVTSNNLGGGLTRNVEIVKTCDQLIAYVYNETSRLTLLNFNNDITSTPTLSDLGGYSYFYFRMFTFQNKLYGHFVHPLYPLIESRVMQTLPTATPTFYSNQSPFNVNGLTPGVYNLSLLTDFGNILYPDFFCKKIVVVASGGTNRINKAICKDSVLTLTASMMGDSTRWNSGETTASIQINTPGVYAVNIYNNSCTTIDSFFVSVDTQKVQASKDTTICKGSTFVLQSSFDNATWVPSTYLNNANIPNPTTTVLDDITYVVSAISPNGCPSKDTVNIIVTNTINNFKIWATDSTLDCYNSSTQLFASGAQNYRWSPPEFCDNPNSSSPIIKPNANTVFYVYGDNGDNCTVSDSIAIIFDDSHPFFFVPNAFSPNGDGLNDKFIPLIGCNFTMEVFSVYNRWGERVYSTFKIGDGWNGNIGDKQATLGVYYWLISGKDDQGNKVFKKGDVTLFR
jgi:gliding motility-associated-like protein